MVWNGAIDFHEDFVVEFESFTVPIKVEIMAIAEVLAEVGPSLGRPHVDTLHGSVHQEHEGAPLPWHCWRMAFAFTPKRRALLLAAGDRSGMNTRRFYGRLIRTADDRFDRFLNGTTGSA